MNNRMVGPPNPQVYAPRQLEGRQEDPRPSIKDMYPMAGAQASDLISSEDLFHNNPLSEEKNPLPGMDHTLGRLGWGAVETLGVHQLLKHNPKLGKLTILGLATLHGLLARNNSMQASWDKSLNRRMK